MARSNKLKTTEPKQHAEHSHDSSQQSAVLVSRILVYLYHCVAAAIRYGVASLRTKFEADIYFGFVLRNEIRCDDTRIVSECTSKMHAKVELASSVSFLWSLVMQTHSNGRRIEMLNSIQLVEMHGRVTTNDKWFSVPVDRIGHGQRENCCISSWDLSIRSM